MESPPCTAVQGGSFNCGGAQTSGNSETVPQIEQLPGVQQPAAHTYNDAATADTTGGLASPASVETAAAAVTAPAPAVSDDEPRGSVKQEELQEAAVKVEAAAAAVQCELPQLQPLAPPDPSEGAEAAAEYQVYLQRWAAGDTLAQRWDR